MDAFDEWMQAQVRRGPRQANGGNSVVFNMTSRNWHDDLTLTPDQAKRLAAHLDGLADEGRRKPPFAIVLLALVALVVLAAVRAWLT